MTSTQTRPTYVIRHLLLSVLLLLAPLAQATDQDPQVAWNKIKAGAMVLDVRTADEFASGHLDKAVNIPHEQVAAEFAKRGIAKETPVVLYCKSGRRSAIANDALTAAGYTQLYNGGAYETLLAKKPKQ